MMFKQESFGHETVRVIWMEGAECESQMRRAAVSPIVTIAANFNNT